VLPLVRIVDDPSRPATDKFGPLLLPRLCGSLSPASRRGLISVTMFMIGIIGQGVTPCVALALVPNFEIGWRILFLIGALIRLAGGGRRNGRTGRRQPR